MKAHSEKVAFIDSGFHAFERTDSEFPFYWHYHPEFELTLIVDSYGQRLVGDSIADYRTGDLVLLGRTCRTVGARVPSSLARRGSIAPLSCNFVMIFWVNSCSHSRK